jgi:hypothetical protein
VFDWLDLGVYGAIYPENHLFGREVEQDPVVRTRICGSYLFCAGSRTDSDFGQSLIQRSRGEVLIQEGLADTFRKPRPVDSDRFIAGVSDAHDMSSDGPLFQPEPFGCFVGKWLQFADWYNRTFAQACSRDPTGHAVYPRHGVNEGPIGDSGADSAMAFDESGSLQGGDGLSDGRSADLVGRHQIRFGGEAVIELAS